MHYINHFAAIMEILMIKITIIISCARENQRENKRFLFQWETNFGQRKKSETRKQSIGFWSFRWSVYSFYVHVLVCLQKLFQTMLLCKLFDQRIKLNPLILLPLLWNPILLQKFPPKTKGWATIFACYSFVKH